MLAHFSLIYYYYKLINSIINTIELISRKVMRICSAVSGIIRNKCRFNVLNVFDKHAHLKYRYGNRKFWCIGFYVDTVGRNKKVIEECIRNQLQEDIIVEQLTIMEYIEPFTIYRG